MKSAKPRICFLSLNSYPILARRNLGFAGGAELQQVLLARELAIRGYHVSFVTYDHGQHQASSVGKIDVIKTYDRDITSEINFFSKFQKICKALDEACADLYFFSAGSPGILPFFCFAEKKKFVFRIPSNKVVLGDADSLMARFAERLDIKRADRLVVQSEFQRNKLMQNFKVNQNKIFVIKNALPVPNANAEKSTPPVVLWVGSILSVKRPHLFIELAKALPDAVFEMIGGKSMDDPQLFEEVRSLSKDLPNFVFRGFVPYHMITRYFDSASVFVNTSIVEGFPNTFLQAWAHYVPVVSLSVDPDNVIKKKNLGFCSNDFQHLVSDVERLLHDEQLRKTLGYNARKHFEAEHDIHKMSGKYDEIFQEILRS